MAEAQRQEIVLEERSLGWDQPGGAVPPRPLTLLSPQKGPGRRPGKLVVLAPGGTEHLAGKATASDSTGHTPGSMAGRAHQARGRGQS